MSGLHVLAFVLPSNGWELTGGIGVAVAVLGVWLRWRSQWDIASVEESLKNRKMTDERAHRKIRWIEQRAVALTGLGLGLLVVALVILTLGEGAIVGVK